MKAIRAAGVPSALLVGLSAICSEVSAADVVTVPDGGGTWEMTISPQAAASPAAETLLVAYQDEATEAPVPAPVELVAPGEPAAEGAIAPAAAANPAEPLPAVAPAPAVDPAAYWCVYRTIPFIRTEYLANPSYRHEATMEFLFGELRPTVIHKTQAPAPIVPPVPPAIVPPYVYDIYLGQIPTFVDRYVPPAIPLNSYPLSY